MPHDAPLISTIVAALVLAFVFGALANRFRMPPLVGYLVAGIVVGPYTPGFIADSGLAQQLSEIGVILLMFGVGLHFSLKDLISVQAVAVPGALLRIAGGTAMGVGLAYLMGWTLGAGIVFGLALSVASTVVLLKALQDHHMVDSDRGRIAIGWVIVEDIAMVLALVLIPAFAGVLGGTGQAPTDPFVNLIERFAGFKLDIYMVLGVTILKLAAFLGFMLVVGRRIIPWILHLTAHTGSRELFRLAVLAIALGVAAGASYLFGVSLALGAFFAGMILSESELSNRAAQESLPFRDAFSVLFFVSVGMLFDPFILINHPLEVVGTLLIILVGKSAFGFLLLLMLRRTASAALTISASLAQIGEFSFILAALGVGMGIMPPEGQSYILAGALLSIILNPAMFYLAERWRPRLESRVPVDAAASGARVEPALDGAVAVPAGRAVDEADERSPTSLSGHVVLIGYGRVGNAIAEGLKQAGMPFVLVEDADNRVKAAHAAGIEVIVGNAATSRTLALANIAGASAVLIAIPNAFEAGQAVEQCRKLNPTATIVSRAHADEEIGYLTDLGANHVIMGEREIGMGMLGWVNGDTLRAANEAGASAGLAAVEAALKIEPRLVPLPAGPAAPAVPAMPLQLTEPAKAPVEPEKVQPPVTAAEFDVSPSALPPAPKPKPSAEPMLSAIADALAVPTAAPRVDAPSDAKAPPAPKLVIKPKAPVAPPQPPLVSPTFVKRAEDAKAVAPPPVEPAAAPPPVSAPPIVAPSPVAKPAAPAVPPPDSSIDASAEAAVSGFVIPPPPPKPRIRAPSSSPGNAFTPDSKPPVKDEV